jgi:hypothetical protein
MVASMRDGVNAGDRKVLICFSTGLHQVSNYSFAQNCSLLGVLVDVAEGLYKFCNFVSVN